LAEQTVDQQETCRLLRMQWELAREIHQGSDPLVALESTLARVVSGTELVGTWVWFTEHPGAPFQLVSSFGLIDNVLDLLENIPADEPLLERLEAGCQIDGLEVADWGGRAATLKAAGWQNAAVWPLRANDVTVGAIGVTGDSEGGLEPATELLMQSLAVQWSGRIARLRVEATLRNNGNNLRTLFDAFENYLYIVTPGGEVLCSNSTRCVGLRADERLKNSDDVAPATFIDDLVPGASTLLAAARNGKTGSPHTSKGRLVQGRVLDATGEDIPVEMCIVPGQWDGQSVFFIACRDVSQRLEMEKERRQLAAAIEHAAESIVITDAAGVIEYANPAFGLLTGYSREEAVGMNPRTLKSGVHDTEFYRLMWDTLVRGEVWSGRLVNKKKDGTLFTEEATISPIRGEGGTITHFVAVKRDVTTEEDLENRLRASQKMEAIGTLAGGIAHDFNNILYALLGYTQLALDDVPEPHPARVALGEIARAGQRASDLVAKMLTFGQRAETGRETVWLQQVVAEVLDLARASLPATIEFRMDLDPDCPPVYADSTQIHQVVLNLCTNAEHAMRDGGGALSVTLRRVHRDTHITDGGVSLPPGDWVQLEFSDTGQGIDASVQERIFEPYYTTKKSHEGTGLGLATVHGIVLNHEGHIFVDGEVGTGTKFTICLPVQPVTTTPETTETTVEPVDVGSAHVLVIDDESMIVDVSTRALERLGYKVTGMTDGIRAVEVFRADPDAFDLVITDQTMPNITGFELASQLLSIRPDLPILLMTGYDEQFFADRMQDTGIACLLPKPLKIEKLAEAVSRFTGSPIAT